MRQYQNLVYNVLSDGIYKPNRTSVDTISSFSHHYTVDLQEGFPLLTTKDLSGFRWNSLIHELEWYLSGVEHIRDLREETGIWDAWADDRGRLDTAYGRFWRRFPVPDEGLEGEAWPDDTHRWMNDDGTFDQIQYVVDTLNESPHSRRLVVSAWHPANAAVSTLPPCHYSFVFNVQGDRLNCHLTQRSGDIALGIPFNIASYSILLHLVAQETGFEVGDFAHTIVDSHVYCGKGDRGDWYGENLPTLQDKLAETDDWVDYSDVYSWLGDAAPDEADGQEGYDHVPGLLRQLAREPRERPTLELSNTSLDDFSHDDVALSGYDPAEGISFSVAE